MSDRRGGAGLFLEAARLAGLTGLALITRFTGVARIAGLAWFTLIARVTRLALFAEIAALLRLLFVRTRSLAGGGGTVLSSFGVACAVAFGAEDRTIAATVVARVLVVVGGLSTGGERVALPVLGGADFVLGWEDFELSLFGGLIGRHRG